MSSALGQAPGSLTDPRGDQAGMSPEQPLPWPLVPITGLSCVPPDQPLPNPFQHPFWFFSGDAGCPAHLPAHL